MAFPNTMPSLVVTLCGLYERSCTDAAETVVRNLEKPILFLYRRLTANFYLRSTTCPEFCSLGGGS